MSKLLTREQVKGLAREFDIDENLVMTIVVKESRRAGFDNEGQPTILFERHWFYRLLGKAGKMAIRDQASRISPNICSSIPGGYGLFRIQHQRLQTAAGYDRECALQSASWGCMQVMGFNYKAAGHASLQSFINAMYADEYSQVKAGLSFMKNSGCLKYIKDHQWASFARAYNGPGYAANNYDKDLASIYAGIVKNGYKLASEG